MSTLQESTGLMIALALFVILNVVATTRFIQVRRRNEALDHLHFRLAPSFESGLWGGLLGGTASGLLNVALDWYFYAFTRNGHVFLSLYFDGSWETVTVKVFLPTVVFVAFAGAVVSAGVQLGALLLSRYRDDSRGWLIYNEVSGGVGGGMLSGGLSGLLLGPYLGSMELPPMSPPC